VTLLCSCKSKDSRLIPVRDLVDILSEVYIADGILSFQTVRAMFWVKDSTTNYIDIIERHGFTKKRIDNTLRYYFEKNPKKLQNIYDQVLTRLEERQALLEKTIPPVQQPRYDLWIGKPYAAVPESGVKDPVWFSVPIKDTGIYILEFTATIFADDQSVNPRITVFFWHTDSSKTEYRINWPEVNLIKDVQAHNYSLSKRNTDTVYNHIGGWLLNSDPREGRWEKHAKIEYIRLRKANMQ
jgi:hypothetical protein